MQRVSFTVTTYNKQLAATDGYENLYHTERAFDEETTLGELIEYAERSAARQARASEMYQFRIVRIHLLINKQ